MKQITLLSQETIDKIAAGEVVERPGSVVKELVENSMDAGANAVTVEIRDGGIAMVRVTDNGEGIPVSQVREAFLRHATSKIRDAEDLAGVQTMGFRGEALSSISAVSQVELITRQESDITGIRFTVNGGAPGQAEEVGAPRGTTIIVRNLFYNTPARKKFLKSPAAEAGHISELMERLALSRPDISFKCIVNGQIRLHTSGNGSLKDVIYSIFGRDVAAGLIETSYEDETLRLEGYIGKPELSRGNRNYETYFVEGRYVRSRVLMKAIEDGYGNHLMQHRYPFTVLSVRVPRGGVDVNVHPAKQEVRFADNSAVYEKISGAVRESLQAHELIPEAKAATQREIEKERKKEAGELLRLSRRAPEPFEEVRRDLFRRGNSPYAPRYSHVDGNARTEKTGRPEMPDMTEKNRTGVAEEGAAFTAAPGAPNAAAATDAPRPEGRPVQASLFEGGLFSPENVQEHRLIGQVFGTFWIVEFRDRLYIIDQHAAHEKVIYERLVKGMKEKKMTSQMLAVPVIVTLSAAEEERLAFHRELFESAGFEIEHFGGKEYAIRAVPDNLYGFTDEELFVTMLDSLGEPGGAADMEFVLEKLAGMACKAAIKGNHRYTEREANALIAELLGLENPYNCPHGRPTIISMSQYELEKKFKRIV